MAEKKDDSGKDEKDGAEAGGKPSFFEGKKKLIALIAGGLLLISLSIGGTLALLGVFDSDGEEEVVDEVVDGETGEGGETAETGDGQAIYFPMKPSLIINYNVRGRQRLLQADITIMTRDVEVIGAVQNHMPLIRNRLNLLYSGEIYDELLTAEGRELLRQKTLKAIQGIMEKEIGKPGVEQVFFTNFVMQ